MLDATKQDPARPSAVRMNELVLELMRGINGLMFDHIGTRVLSGPFKGMEIPSAEHWEDGNSGTKLLGCYEFELHEAVEKAIERKPAVVINVGCAEGYYAVGFGRRLPSAQIIGVDKDGECVRLCREYGLRNGVNVEPVVADPASLAEVESFLGHRLYFIDCESIEDKLLDPTDPALLRSDIIVECHDFMIAGISDRVRERFSASHWIDEYRSRVPDIEKYAGLFQGSAMIMKVMAVTEKRPEPTCWLACWTKHQRG